MDAARTAGGRPRCVEPRAEIRTEGGRADDGRRGMVDRGRLCGRPRSLPCRTRETREARMIRPGLAFALWLAIAVLVVVNDTLGDTIIVERLSTMTVEWYKALVPLPYVLLMAVIHARRTRGPQWLEAALLAALLWPTTTVLVDYLYERFTFGQEAIAFVDRFAFWWGAPYPLLVIALFAAPLVAGAITARRPRRADA